MTVSARSCARGTSEASSTNSSGLWARAADRPDGADGRRAGGRGKAGVGAAAGEHARNGLAERMPAGGVRLEQALAVCRRHQRQKFGIGLQPGTGAGHARLRHDRFDGGQHAVAVGGIDIAQVDLARSRGRHRVHRLPAFDHADIDGDALGEIGERVQGDDLVRDFADGAGALLEIGAGMGGLAGDGEAHEDARLAPGHDGVGRAAGLAVEHEARAFGFRLDRRARGRRADLLVGGDQHDERRRRAAQSLKRRGDKAVHHHAGLHVGDARPVTALALHAERPARRLALGKHRVAMAHEQDVALAAHADRGADAIAELVVGDHVVADAVAVEETAERRAGAVDAGFIVGAAVDVDQLRQQAAHGLALPGQPIEHFAFVRCDVRLVVHVFPNRCPASRAASSMLANTAPALASSSSRPSSASMR